MALDFDLELATAVPAEQVAAELHAVGATFGAFDRAITAKELLGEGVVTVRDTWVRVRASTTTRPWKLLADRFGFTPTVRVDFREDKFADGPAQDDDIVRLSVGLLERVPGDALLYFDEEIWLLRLDDVLTLNEDNIIWPPERLGLVDLPYQRATHTFE